MAYRRNEKCLSVVVISIGPVMNNNDVDSDDKSGRLGSARQC